MNFFPFLYPALTLARSGIASITSDFIILWKIIINDNTVVENQKEILTQTKLFYEKLYRRQECIKDVNLSGELPFQTPKLRDNEKDSLEGNTTLSELTQKD